MKRTEIVELGKSIIAEKITLKGCIIEYEGKKVIFDRYDREYKTFNIDGKPYEYGKQITVIEDGNKIMGSLYEIAGATETTPEIEPCQWTKYDGEWCIIGPAELKKYDEVKVVKKNGDEQTQIIDEKIGEAYGRCVYSYIGQRPSGTSRCHHCGEYTIYYEGEHCSKCHAPN